MGDGQGKYSFIDDVGTGGSWAQFGREQTLASGFSPKGKPLHKLIRHCTVIFVMKQIPKNKNPRQNT